VHGVLFPRPRFGGPPSYLTGTYTPRRSKHGRCCNYASVSAVRLYGCGAVYRGRGENNGLGSVGGGGGGRPGRKKTRKPPPSPVAFTLVFSGSVQRDDDNNKIPLPSSSSSCESNRSTAPTDHARVHYTRRRPRPVHRTTIFILCAPPTAAAEFYRSPTRNSSSFVLIVFRVPFTTYARKLIAFYDPPTVFVLFRH